MQSFTRVPTKSKVFCCLWGIHIAAWLGCHFLCTFCYEQVEPLMSDCSDNDGELNKKVTMLVLGVFTLDDVVEFFSSLTGPT